MTHILVVEDDREICQLYERVLLKQGYQVTTVSNGRQALEAIDHSYFDLILSDIMMPEMNGYELVRELRSGGCNTPVMMITAKDAFDDKRQGFLSGSDDYMVKPVDLEEIVLRVGALLRRAKINHDRRIVLGDTVLDMDSFTVSSGGEVQTLPQKEFMLLYKLASYPGKIFTRNQLMDEIWGYDSPSDTHTVDVHVGRLRDRFRENGDFKIVTIRGVGFKVVRK